MMNVTTLIKQFYKYNEGYLGKKTVEWYRTYLRPLEERYGDKAIDQITFDDLQELILSAREDLSVFSRFNFVRAWKRLFRWAQEGGYLSINPADRLRRPLLPKRTPAAILEKDIEILIQWAGRTTIPERDIALILFLMETGVRAGGAANIKLESLDIEKRRAIVSEKGRGGKKERLVFFGSRTADALNNWFKKRRGFADQDDSRVFLLREQGIYQLLKRLAARSGIKGKWNPHSFRHAFARRMLSRGMSIGVVSHLMGHSDVKVTIDFYGRFDGDELQSLYDRFNT